MPLKPIHWRILLALATVKLIFHLFTNVNYGFHRDEMLYLALGRHLDFGYWSNPPLIGWIAAFIQTVLGDSMFAVRLIPSLLGTGLLVLTGVMAREMGAGKYGQFLAALCILVSPAYMRGSWLFQPVMIDVCFWALFCYLILRYLNTADRRYLLYFGVAFGFGFLNKYIVIFFLMALLIGLLFTPHRRLLWSKHALWTALIAFAIAAPNLIWQYLHGFPVVTHMRELSEKQLVNVDPVGFFADQLLMNFPAFLIWIGGLLFLLFYQKAKNFRLIGLLFIATIAVFLLFRGKSYYTLGIYPVMLAAGSVYFEQLLPSVWLRVALPVLMLTLLLPALPLGVPFLSIPDMVQYSKWTAKNLGLENRWEDGKTYPLPQDYADMLGWEELAQHVMTAYHQVADKSQCLIYCENYGQAGAVALFAKGLPPINSFSDTYRLWIQKNTDATTLIYVNDELGEDVQAIFADIKAIGKISNLYAREYGTTVYLCEQPRQPFGALWKQRVQEVLNKEDRVKGRKSDRETQ